MPKTLLPKQVYPLLLSLGALLIILVVVRRIEDSGSAEVEALYIMGLPEVPDVSGWPPEFGVSLGEAYAGVADKETRFHSLAKLGKLYHANGFAEQAANCYKALMELQPGNALWPYLHATVFEDYSDQSVAIEYLEKARELDPSYEPIALRLGWAYLKTGDLAKAREHFAAHLKGSEGDAQALRGLAEVARREGKFEESRAFLDRLISEGHEVADVYWKRADVFEEEGRLEQSLLDIARAEAAPEGNRWIDPWLLSTGEYCYEAIRLKQFSRAARESDHLPKAKRFAKRALSLRPEDPETRLALARAYEAKGHSDSAEEVLLDAAKATPESDAIFLELARMYRKDGRNGKAAEILREGLETVIYEAEMLTELAALATEKGESQEALALLRRAVSEDPNLRVAARELALLEIERELPEGEENLWIYLRMAPYDAANWLRLGKLQLKKRQWDLALHAFEKALVADEENRHARRLLAMTYRHMGSQAASMGNVDEAIAKFRQAIAANPSDAKSFLNLGALFEARGDDESAIELYSRYVDLKPEDSDGFLKLGRLLVSAGQHEMARVALLDGRRCALEAERHSDVLQFDALLDVVE